MNKKQISILYIEDEIIVSTAMKKILSGKFQEVVTAEDGVQGLDFFQKLRPNIVLTDIRMPKMDGLELCRKIKALDPNVPIVGITASTEEDTLKICKQAGMSLVLTKPVNFVDIIQQIEDLVNKAESKSKQII
ncbi:response regulator [Leptospira perolatii]|uniref:Response regulator n=1 Tax=Leptospira perolatii TaxID=2023191 RepID=A0A2M9ZSS0_9LEPT|nr:response regulator [Leptospira perolatii]PJZ68792.1 response regulator [Leptospira perolatii]PJZ75147.1 response regulator [Leptospira perolatii]